jgi:DNA invertase Pin-like site-specific DNA recombinase
MSASELITPHHLQRKALIYIRVSSPNQVLTSKESLELQYALQQRALSLGWSPQLIEVIDADLALTATSTRYRTGFQALVGKVALGEVGIILSCEVARLSRNCTDWYRLLDVCGYKGCLIGDEDGVYDPASANGRLLLGVKGQLSEYELHTLKARLRAGLLNKAQRGQLEVQLPVGLVRDETGQVHKDPNQLVQERIGLVFSTFLRVKTLSKVLRFFNAQHLEVPRADPYGQIIWKKPNNSAILTILTNPAYAGTFAYGKTCLVHPPKGGPRGTQKKLPLDEWKIVVQGVYPAYIDWQTFLQIQAQLHANYAEYDRAHTRGVPRGGAALLQGLVYCGECGHKMAVQYKGWNRYICNHLYKAYRQTPICQDLPADPIDTAVTSAFFEALAPLELDVYSQALQNQKANREQLEKTHR